MSWIDLQPWQLRNMGAIDYFNNINYPPKDLDYDAQGDWVDGWISAWEADGRPWDREIAYV